MASPERGPIAHLEWAAMPSHMTRSLAVLVSAVAVAGLTVACSPSADPAGDRDKPAGRSAAAGSGSTRENAGASAPAPPRAGECRDLGYAEVSLFSDETRTTPCAKKHTAYTFAVKKLPRDIAFTGVAIENDAVQNFAGESCRTAFARFIGGDAAERALSRLTVTYFVPNQRHFDLGARWVRCDVVALQSANVLADLPRRLRSILDVHSALERFGVCSTAEPGSAGFRLVMCSQDHAYRALAALRLGGSHAPYPGEPVARGDGRQRCEDLVDDALGPGGGYTFGWTYPSAADWRAGQRFGYCWHKTTR